MGIINKNEIRSRSISFSKRWENVERERAEKDTFWNDYLNVNPYHKKETLQSFYFCDNKKDADECAELVVKGIKQATATSLWWFKKNNVSLPRVGDKYIVTDWVGNPRVIIETIKVQQVPFNKITPEFAEIEGEGDKSLDYWKKVHEAYYKREMNTHFEKFDENMIIICEYFKKIF